MCYSAQIVADYRKYVKMFGPDVDIGEFARILQGTRRERQRTGSLGRGCGLMNSATEQERRFKRWIERYDAAQTTRIGQELNQCTRLADAARAL